MIVLGLLLMFIGFMIIVPRGGISGSAAARNVGMGMQGIQRTPGYRKSRESGRSSSVRIAIGVVMFSVGLVLVGTAGG